MSWVFSLFWGPLRRGAVGLCGLSHGVLVTESNQLAGTLCHVEQVAVLVQPGHSCMVCVQGALPAQPKLFLSSFHESFELAGREYAFLHAVKCESFSSVADQLYLFEALVPPVKRN